MGSGSSGPRRRQFPHPTNRPYRPARDCLSGDRRADRRNPHVSARRTSSLPTPRPVTKPLRHNLRLGASRGATGVGCRLGLRSLIAKVSIFVSGCRSAPAVVELRSRRIGRPPFPPRKLVRTAAHRSAATCPLAFSGKPWPCLDRRRGVA